MMVGWGGLCLKKYLEMEEGWNRKEGREHKYFKKGGKLCQGVGALKRGAGTPLGMLMYVATG